MGRFDFPTWLAFRPAWHPWVKQQRVHDTRLPDGTWHRWFEWVDTGWRDCLRWYAQMPLRLARRVRGWCRRVASRRRERRMRRAFKDQPVTDLSDPALGLVDEGSETIHLHGYWQ